MPRSELHVLHVLNDLSGGGAERLVLDLCSAPMPGVRSRVLAVHGGGALAGEFAARGVAVQTAGRRRGRLGLRALGEVARASQWADIVHTHLWAGHVWGGLGARLLGRVRLVRTEHNVVPDSPTRGRILGLFDPLADRVVYVSHSAAGAAARSRDPRTRVIPNGVDLAPYRAVGPSAPGASHHVVALGRLVPQKGMEVLLEATRLAPGLRTTVYGAGPLRASLAARAGERVHLAGFTRDVPQALGSAGVVAIPSLWEGFGLVAVEAMAAGRPVVCSDDPALVEVTGDAAVHVPRGDPAALAQALLEVSTNPRLAARMVEKGHVRAERFGLGRCVRAHGELYRGLGA